jgi:hypothetical protein
VLTTAWNIGFTVPRSSLGPGWPPAEHASSCPGETVRDRATLRPARRGRGRRKSARTAGSPPLSRRAPSPGRKRDTSPARAGGRLLLWKAGGGPGLRCSPRRAPGGQGDRPALVALASEADGGTRARGPWWLQGATGSEDRHEDDPAAHLPHAPEGRARRPAGLHERRSGRRRRGPRAFARPSRLHGARRRHRLPTRREVRRAGLARPRRQAGEVPRAPAREERHQRHEHEHRQGEE